MNLGSEVAGVVGGSVGVSQGWVHLHLVYVYFSIIYYLLFLMFTKGGNIQIDKNTASGRKTSA